MSVAVILVAAGQGERLGAGKPKALVHVAGVTLLEHAISRAVATKNLKQLVITATPGFRSEFLELAKAHVPSSIELSVVEGGETRQLSIALALAEVSAEAEVILVHDAARAFTPTEVFDRVVAEVTASGFGVIPVIPVHDTVKRAAGTEVLETVDRSELRAAQTPQGFPASMLREAYAAITKDHTDDASLVQAAGHRVLSVAGDRMAMKVTTKDDLILASHLIGGQQRTGIGTDTHRFSEDETKPLFLGTIEWPGERGLDGHSDGDALSHAIVDALLSAAGLGDIGLRLSDCRVHCGLVDLHFIVLLSVGILVADHFATRFGLSFERRRIITDDFLLDFTAATGSHDFLELSHVFGRELAGQESLDGFHGIGLLEFLNTGVDQVVGVSSFHAVFVSVHVIRHRGFFEMIEQRGQSFH